MKTEKINDEDDSSQNDEFINEFNAYEGQNDHFQDENCSNNKQEEKTLFDTADIFKTDIIFVSHDAAFNWCVDRGLKNRIFIVRFTTHVLQKYKTKRHVVVACECSGKPRIKLKPMKKDDSKRRATTTKRTNCPFRLRIVEIGDDKWKLQVVKGGHNHSPNLYEFGHSLACKLSQKHVETTKRLTKAGVKPRQIIAAITDEDPSNFSKKQTIYNIRHQLKREIMEDRSVLQQFVKVLGDNGYKYQLRKISETNVVKDVLFVNPESLKLLHAFPYILIMDSTYNTNRYKVPSFEIVGITSTGNSFVAGYAFLSSEKEDVYTWVLDMFGKHMVKQPPTVIITDRELALINAVTRIFPSTFHMLCRFHIEKDVEAMVLKRTRNKSLATSFKEDLKKNVFKARSVDNYEKRWGEFREKYKRIPHLLKYVEDTWLTPYRTKVVSAWVNHHLHFGNHTTNRVESEHAALKSNIGTACGAYDYVLERIDMGVKTRLIELKSKFEQSRCQFPRYANDKLFHKLKGEVSLKALSILHRESKRMHLLQSAPSICACMLRNSHGLPCAHEMLKYSKDGIPIYAIHCYWRTLNMETKVKEESLDEESLINEEIEEVFKHVKGQCLEAKRKFVERLKEVAFPYDAELNEPEVKRRRGRPKNNSTSRDHSAWEYIDKKYQAGRGRGRPPKVPGRGKRNESGRGKTNEAGHTPVSGTTFPYFDHITRFMGPFIIEWHSVKVDGNCGYRSIAREVYKTEEAWVQVRRDLYAEISRRLELYRKACLLDITNNVEHLLKTVQHFKREDAPLEKWMSGCAIGPVVATCYQRPFVIFSSPKYSFTALPLVSTTYIPVLVPPTDPEIVIGYCHDISHYIWMKMRSECPLPPIHQLWIHYREIDTDHFSNALSSRLGHYKRFLPPTSPQFVSLDD